VAGGPARHTDEHRQRSEAGPEHERSEQRLVGKLGRKDHHKRGQSDGEVHRATVTNPPHPRWRGRTSSRPGPGLPARSWPPGLLAWALLGDGRRCETWLAWDLGRWCPVAVKLPRPGPGTARAAAALTRAGEGGGAGGPP